MNYTEILVAWSRRKRSARFRFLTLLLGAIFFLVIFAWLVVWASNWLVQTCRAVFVTPLPVVGWFLALIGLALAVWTVLVMWFAADGTPAPTAPTQRLITHGPFRYCRNPLQLAVMVYLLGLGTALFSLITGIVALAVIAVLGGAYYHFVEERELRARFGEEYEEYRQTTPFVIPRFGKRKDNGTEE